MLELISNTIIEVLKEFECAEQMLVPVGISARHLHLSKEHIEILFGSPNSLTAMKPLSQPGQFAADQKVDVLTPKRTIKNVRVLGPARAATQVELSTADCRKLGIEPVVRGSGDIAGTPGITLKTSLAEISITQGVIVAERHIHMTPSDAKRFGLANEELVEVITTGAKGGVLGNVVIRVSNNYRLDFHIDTDDASAFMLQQGQPCKIRKICRQE